MSAFTPRPAQKRVLEYTHGYMGIKAVPGSGKTHTLSCLASKLLLSGQLQDEQEILIVTLVNSAVENFSRRVAGFIKDFGLLPNSGYRVRTLHGLAHDIVRERPSLAGISDEFQILDEREAASIMENIVANWLHIHPEFVELYTHPEKDLSRNPKYRKDFEANLVGAANNFIRQAKDYQHTPDSLKHLRENLGTSHVLVDFGISIYEEYHRALHYRSAIDFDDLIRLALRALESAPDYLERLRYRWPYILEDEAQDSSRLQEMILAKLAGPDGNWVRVGDPNQAIFETFTTAHPKFLLNFVNRPDVISEELPNSGRSTRSIISLANHLIEWSRSAENPNPLLKDTLTLPYIDPAPLNDPQPNPLDRPDLVVLYNQALEADKELETVAKSLAKWLPDNQDKTAAVLVPRNERGTKMVDMLKRYRIEPVELLRSSLTTRQTADILATILEHLANPNVRRHLVDVYRKIKTFEADPEKETLVSKVSRILKDCVYPEQLLWPHSRDAWLELLPGRDVPVTEELDAFCALIRKWHRAALLPVDQLILTIAHNLFHHPVDLALSHKLAVTLSIAAANHPDWALPQFAHELQEIASNRRKFIGFSDEDTGFDPEQHKGKVVVSTMHKAKGLEWDRVYLTSVNQYDFPFGIPGDQYIGEKWFIRNHLNLPEEVLARLSALIEQDYAGLYIDEGEATQAARIGYAQERLRLLYVGITRAKSELIITWNTGKSGGNQAAVPLVELIRFWEKRQDTHG